jgi:UDP-N-acetylglucosamine 4,6-dehydratase
MRDSNIIFHAAAMKHVHVAEVQPYEAVLTNVIGGFNVSKVAVEIGAEVVVALSTDKASSPINLYGATKLAADKLCQSANHYAAGYETRFSVVRYGNVMGSRGSVIPFWEQLAAEGKEIPITDSRMTRFWITLPQAVKFVVESFDLMHGGEVFVPRIPSMKILDLAEAVAPGAKTNEIGIRPGEKLHEEMIAADDSRRTISLSDRYVILPTIAEWGYEPLSGDSVADGFAYRSDSNDTWLSVDEIRKLLQE